MMSSPVDDWLKRVHSDKKIVDQVANRVISDVIGKAKDPKSLKIKVKFGNDGKK
jgi:hypothetical protein